MPEMVRRSDLIVRGRLTEKTARLSDDESTVFTDYAITPTRVLKRPMDLAISQAPGGTPAITLQEVGGTLVVDGLRLETQTDSHDPGRPLTVGDEYVLFLMKPVPSSATTKRIRSGVFELASGKYAVFPIRAGKVEVFTKVAANRGHLTSDDPEAFLGSVQQLIDTAAKGKQ